MLIVLGSKSPRRREILANAGYQFIVDVADTDEDVIEKDPVEYVKKTAQKKGEATVLKHPQAFVICADTIVVCNNEVLEKPKDQSDAYRMIKLLQGQSHEVYTAVYISYQNKTKVMVEKTKVFIAKMSEQEITEYIQTNEPYDKAGGYAIQGIFAKFITSIEGDYYNVMGLPLHLVYNEIKKHQAKDS